jgi:hypothetical protein
MIERASWRARGPGATNIEDKTASSLEYSLNLSGVWKKPFNILVLVGVAILFLEMKGIWWRCYDQIHTTVR